MDRLAGVGAAHVLQLKLVDARKVSLVAAATVERADASAGSPLDMARQAVTRLLADHRGPPVGDGDPTAWVRRGIGVTGAVVAAVSAFAVPAGGALVALGAAGVLVPLLVYVPTPGLPGELRVVLLPSLGAASALGGALTGLVAAVLLSVGLATVAAAWLLGVS